MGSYDCYCAFCGGPLNPSPCFGSKLGKYLAKRHKRVQKKQRDVNGEDVEESEESDVPLPDTEMEDPSPSEPAPSDLIEQDQQISDATSAFNRPYPNLDTEDPYGVAPWESDSDQSQDDKSVDSWNEEHSYDPRLLRMSDLAWLLHARCLCFNPEAEHITKAFLSGHGVYDDYGHFDVKANIEGPDAPDEDFPYPCYYAFDANELPVFPFHDACYGIFAHALFGVPDITMVDKDALYSTMSSLAPDYTHSLDVDYGGIQGMEQTWESVEGEEYSVCNPGRNLKIASILQSILPTRLFHGKYENVDLSHKVRNDPFTKLPYDILHTLIRYLPTNDFIAVIQASWYVSRSTRDLVFWKSMVRQNILPWFWEFESVFRQLPDDLDFKGLYFWLDKVTMWHYGMVGPFLGIANRRRIWSVCQQLIPAYRRQVPEDYDRSSEDDEVAQGILNHAASLSMPMVAFPKPREARAVSKQWICSWEELTQPAVFESFWSQEGALVGLAITISDQRRVFGQLEDHALGITSHSVGIPSNEWIAEIILYIQDVDMFGPPKNPSKYMTALSVEPTRPVFVEGITITLTSGVSLDVMKPQTNCNQRVLAVNAGMHLIGLTGRVAMNHVITHLGLLQGMPSLNDTNPSHSESYDRRSVSAAQRLLWKEPATKIPADSRSSSQTCPIWKHPHIRMLKLVMPNGEWAIPSDMLPHHVLLWAHDPSEYQFLRRISAFEVMSGWASGGSVAGGNAWKAPIKDIVGLRAEYSDNYSEEFRVIGSGGPVPAQMPDWKPDRDNINSDPQGQAWFEKNMNHFDIDGAGGEVVTDVQIANRGNAIKLNTNRDRVVHFGEREGAVNDWSTLTAAEGEVIVGLVVCFGSLSGWSWDTKRQSHWKTAAVTALTMSKNGTS